MLSKEEMIVDIRELIRLGHKTSWIIANTAYPVDLIKAVKSEELELDKENAREKERKYQADRAARKKVQAHRAFLIRMGVSPDRAQMPPEPNYEVPKSEESKNKGYAYFPGDSDIPSESPKN